MRRLLVRLVEALCRYGDPTVMRYADLTGPDTCVLHDGVPLTESGSCPRCVEALGATGWDDYGYRAPTPPTTKEDR